MYTPCDRSDIERAPESALEEGRLGIGRLIHAVRARRKMEEQQSAAAPAQQERQAQLQKYDRALGPCLTGRGYAVQ